MSLNLLPVQSGSEQVDISYKNFLPTTADLYSCVSTISYRVLFLGFRYNGGVMKIYKMNLMTNAFEHIGDISNTDLESRQIGGILADDNFIYLSASTGYTEIRKYKLSDLSYVKKYTYVTASPQSYGKIQWDKNGNIVLQYGNGFLFFDPTREVFDYKTYTSALGCRDMSVGRNIVIGNRSDSQTYPIFAYDIENDTFVQKSLSSTIVSCSCYENGKFYIAQSGYLYIMDESTLDITPINTTWGEPRTINVSGNNVFVTVVNSNRLYIYNTEMNMGRYIILPWNIRGFNVNYVTVASAYSNSLFLPYNTLGRFGGINSAKYNFGQVVKQINVLFNEDTAAQFVYDPRFIEFRETYMTIKDGEIDYNLNTIDVINHIKSCSVSKSDYNTLKSFKLK
jgi:hypothetical protein